MHIKVNLCYDGLTYDAQIDPYLLASSSIAFADPKQKICIALQASLSFV